VNIHTTGGVRMKEFMVLIGQIFVISLVQTVLEAFLDTEGRKYQIRIINIACIVGSLYFLLQFVFDHIMKDVTTFLKIPF
jgi:hypothetical protein